MSYNFNKLKKNVCISQTVETEIVRFSTLFVIQRDWRFQSILVDGWLVWGLKTLKSILSLFFKMLDILSAVRSF